VGSFPPILQSSSSQISHALSVPSRFNSYLINGPGALVDLSMAYLFIFLSSTVGNMGNLVYTPSQAGGETRRHKLTARLHGPERQSVDVNDGQCYPRAGDIFPVRGVKTEPPAIAARATFFQLRKLSQEQKLLRVEKVSCPIGRC
jgi:hypothetical protein